MFGISNSVLGIENYLGLVEDRKGNMQKKKNAVFIFNTSPCIFFNIQVVTKFWGINCRLSFRDLLL